MPLRKHADMLASLHDRLNWRRYVHPDPLEFLYCCEDPADREIVALVASSLAYGRVAQILKSVSAVLGRIGPDPARALADSSPARLRKAMSGFRHRFSTGEQVAAMLAGARRVIRRHGSLGACFAAGASPDDETVLPALQAFVGEVSKAGDCGHLLPDPSRKSACKRLNLMLRWMVRRDRVDPGGWDGAAAAGLIVPLDTHMHRIGLGLGATRRKSADMRTAMEITAAFRKILPDDPVRYDFALTRLGIRGEMDLPAFLARAAAV